MRRIPGASKPIAVEVELTDKSTHRLEEILRAWRRSLVARQFGRVCYLCSPRALPYLERAVVRLGGEWAIDVAQLEGTCGLWNLAVGPTSGAPRRSLRHAPTN